jgi:hypothetical protein
MDTQILPQMKLHVNPVKHLTLDERGMNPGFAARRQITPGYSRGHRMRPHHSHV